MAAPGYRGREHSTVVTSQAQAAFSRYVRFTGWSLGLTQLGQGSHSREKTAFFTQKKSRLRKSENAVRLLYAKNSDLTHQNAFSLFVFCTQQRFVEHLP